MRPKIVGLQLILNIVFNKIRNSERR